MFFLPVMDIWLANEPSLEQVIPNPIQDSTPLEEEEEFLDEIIEIKPFFLEGSVDQFDAVTRASKLVEQLPRNFCGTYKSFDEELNQQVTLIFSEVNSVGHIVKLKGEMSINNIRTRFTGVLNAKSDQLELIPLTNHFELDLEEGGSFIGLQGSKLLTWKSSRLDHPGGRLELKEQCKIGDLSKSLSIRPIW